MKRLISHSIRFALYITFNSGREKKRSNSLLRAIISSLALLLLLLLLLVLVSISIRTEYI